MKSPQDIGDNEVIWHPLEGKVRVAVPTSWTPEMVAARILESTKVVSTTIPPNRSMGNGWPAIMREWDDYLGRGDEQRGEVWEQWGRTRPQYDAETMSRVDEAAHWPIRYLNGNEGASRVVMAWATARVAGMPVGALLRKTRWAPSTFRKRRADGLRIIAQALNTNRVRVREAQVWVD